MQALRLVDISAVGPCLLETTITQLSCHKITPILQPDYDKLLEFHFFHKTYVNPLSAENQYFKKNTTIRVSLEFLVHLYDYHHGKCLLPSFGTSIICMVQLYQIRITPPCCMDEKNIMMSKITVLGNEINLKSRFEYYINL